jgi:enoyl-CoA hydratase
MFKYLLIERERHVATVTLNRPAARHALSAGLQAEIVSAFEELAKDETVCAIVLTGAGDRAFCAGLDIKELSEGVDLIGAGTDPIEAITRCPKPTIAAVNGAAITGGLELALACDIILSADDAIFADTHAKMGVIPGWGLSHRLARRVGAGRAMEMSFSARAINAATALQWGLVNHLFAKDRLLEEAKALAADIAQWDADFIQQYKSLIQDCLGRTGDEADRIETAAADAHNAKLDPARVGQRGMN